MSEAVLFNVCKTINKTVQNKRDKNEGPGEKKQKTPKKQGGKGENKTNSKTKEKKSSYPQTMPKEREGKQGLARRSKFQNIPLPVEEKHLVENW